MTSDGHRLRESWNNALNDALLAFKSHLTTQSSNWKRIPLPPSSRESSSGTANSAGAAANSVAKGKGKARLDAAKGASVHRRSTKSGDVYRVVTEFPATEGLLDLEAWKAVLATPELRQEWDPAVESARILEMHDPSTRIIKTKFTLGWPANPRDAILISRTFHDATTLVDVSTSLPRSSDEPSYLRPAPPYVRSHVSLFAWFIQILSPEGRPPRIRMTCFWQHDLKTVWNIGTPVSLPQQLSTMTVGLLEVVKNRQNRIPTLVSYGLGVSIERINFDTGRYALTVDYTIVPEDSDQYQDSSNLQDTNDFHAIKEQRRLQRAIELLFPSLDGWDIRIATRASSEAVAQLPWTTSASKCGASKLSFQVRHAPLIDNHSVLKVKFALEYSAASSGIRVNGLAVKLEDPIERELRSFSSSDQLLKDASSAANISLSTASASMVTVESEVSAVSSLRKPSISRAESGLTVVPRGPAFDKSILARVRRNYIYFSSLLQEPEAKWKRNTEVRGVSVTQLDSIDPTLVVYKAEATFVGVGLWDLFSAIVTPGARAHWDRQYDDATLLEDVNELSELWHFKTKPAWPVTGRDAVVLKTVYKAPTTVHVFSFSIDDAHLFPSIPTAETGTIRTQIDLQGWAIEALSPTTTQLTLLEQSDPKGWTGKATVPQQMIAGVAGVGEFAIKCGGPPVLTRLGGARAISQRYEHDRGVFRVEYVPAVERLPSSSSDNSRPSHSRQNSLDAPPSLTSKTGLITPQTSQNSTSASVECELRCDVDTWATSLDIVIDPPPNSISCLRRHRLSAGGGGLWLTVGHDIAFDSSERLLAIVRRAPFTAGKEKGVVMVNGKRIFVDVEELPEAEMKSLAKQKRIKPVRIPLDQPPVMGVIRRRRAELVDGESSDSGSDSGTPKTKKMAPVVISSSYPKVPSPLSSFFTAAMEQMSNTTQQAVAAFVPPVAPTSDVSFQPGKRPMHYALDALAFAQAYHRGAYRDGWVSVGGTGLDIQRRSSSEISPNIPVHRGEKVIEGVAAEEVASVIFSYDCRKKWDDRFDTVSVLEEYGGDCHTAFMSMKSGFPFRDRGLYIASFIARETGSTSVDLSSLTTTPAQTPSSVSNAIYCVSASFNPSSASSFSSSKYNSYTLPIGRVFLDVWIVQTLDPYTAENYTIPSTKCTRLAAIDLAGSVPLAFNSIVNASLPRAVLAVEAFMKGISPSPEMRMPIAGFELAKSAADVTESTWILNSNKETCILLNSKLDLEARSFNANILVTLNRSQTELPSSPSSDEGERPITASTLQAGRPWMPSRPSSPEIMRRPRVDSAPSPTGRHRKSSSNIMSPTGSLAIRSQSREYRSAATIFSIGRDHKTHGPTDFIVAEIVVDMRSYSEGYEVQISSRLQSQSNPVGPLQLSHVSSKSISENDRKVLPIHSNVYVLPPSPLHTSGSGAETPVRHLLRLTLPTAQYEKPTVEDPLTGEMRSAPEKPQWYKDLEGKAKRALVNINIRSLPVDKQKKGKKVILADGVPMIIGSEKDSHKALASENSTAARLSRSRTQEGKDKFELPRQLTIPFAIDDALLDPNAANPYLKEISSSQAPAEPTETHANGNDSDFGTLSDSPAQLTPVEEKQQSLSSDANRGVFGLFSAYQNTLSLLKFGSGSGSGPSTSGTSTPSLLVPRAPGAYPSPAITPPPEQSNDTSKDIPPSSPLPNLASAVSASTLAVVQSATTPRYSISTLIAAILIAFLLGSLLRSLLSPADFIYVVTDLPDAPDGVTRAPSGGLGLVESGWREIKRLVEIKYIVGGWDFQIAVVRRH